MKGIVLAGGKGKRLWPLTKHISKHLLLVYDKPLIHYPISVLMMAGIREILIITNPDELPLFKRVLGDGSDFGVNFSFEIQHAPNGLTEAFTIGRDFIGRDSVSLILGDNIFYGQGLGNQLQVFKEVSGAHVFAYKVHDPSSYGVIEFDDSNKVISIEEKPSRPKSKYAVPGLYFYDNSVIDLAKSLKPSLRGELEISDLNREYLDADKLTVSVLERGTAWLDAGTFDSINAASFFIKTIEDRQGLKVSCLEEIAWRNGWISQLELTNLVEVYKGSPYGSYLEQLIEPS